MRALILILVILALSACRGWTSDKPPVHWNPNMDTQEKGKPFRKDTSGLFSDGRQMRLPVEGTVARGYLHDDDAFELGLDDKGQPLQKLPDAFTVDTNTVARGKNRFLIYCAPCHGKDGDGKGLVAARPQALAVPPPSFLDPRLVQMPAGKMYQAIRNGVNNNNMPSYAAQLPERDRWAVIAFLCTLETGKSDAAVACADKKPAPVGSPGEAVFVNRGCNACHTTDGTKKIGPSWKGIYGGKEQTSGGEVTVDDAYLEESIKNPTAKVVNGFPPVMPPLPLSDQEIKDVIAFIKSLK